MTKQAMKKKFIRIEEAIRQFLSSESEFNGDEQAEVLEYLNAGEYGLAIETLEEIIMEKDPHFQKKVYIKLDAIKKLLPNAGGISK